MFIAAWLALTCSRDAAAQARKLSRVAKLPPIVGDRADGTSATGIPEHPWYLSEARDRVKNRARFVAKQTMRGPVLPWRSLIRFP